MNHLVLRGSTWHVRLSVPKDLRKKLNRREFTKSLKTSSKAVAQRKSLDLLANWKLEIASAGGDANATELLASELRLLDQSSDDKGNINPDTGMSDFDYYVESLADDLTDSQQKEFYEVLSGKRGLSTTALLDKWADAKYPNAKTHGLAIGDVRTFAIYAPTIDRITKSSIKKWLREEKRSKKTVSRALSFCRGYWRFLQDKGVVSDEAFPFDHIRLPDNLSDSGVHREPFGASELSPLFEALQRDTPVYRAALISLHSGARISEVMGLRFEDRKEIEGFDCLHIKGTKTHAADRVVPIHKAVASLLDDIEGSTGEEWIISGVKTSGGAARRGDVIGKRFGRIKKGCGFGSEKVFHSLRKTFITACEQSQVPEGVVADIVGHEKKTITYGLYSGGSSIQQRADAIDRLSFELKSE